MERIQILHNSNKVAEAIARRGTVALRLYDLALGRGARELAREAKRVMPKFRSRTVTATGVEDGGPLEKRVVFATRHARHTEAGTGPGGQPSLQEMIDWVRLKNIQPRTPGMSQRSLAALIRKRIAQRGTQAHPFAAPSLARMRPRLSELMRAATRQALEGRS